MTKILIIDDERSICETLEMFLREKGYEVDTSASGEAGLEFIRKDQPDIVILDLRLPGIDGLEVLRISKQLSPRSMVILTTAYHDEKIYDRAESLGACGYMVKPIDVAEFEAVIDKAARSHRNGHQGKAGTVKTSHN
ncbi:MAG TPA: response regulator [Thermodesulfobacteriota bacterium]|nr:response regulator [Thermodesulfobacteriota bacterium]